MSREDEIAAIVGAATKGSAVDPKKRAAEVAAIVGKPADDKPEPKNRGLFAQAKDLVAGAVTGIPELAKMGAKGVQSGGSFGQLYRIATGEEQERVRRFKAENPDLGLFDSLVGHMQATDPGTAEAFRSMQRTGGRVANPSRYGKASGEGRILETIVEDLGNLSMVAGPAVKGATSSGSIASRAAAGSKLAKGAQGAANVLDRPFVTTGGAAKRAVAPAAGRGLAKLAEGEGNLAALAQKTQQAIDVRPVRRVLNRGINIEGNEMRQQTLGPIAKAAAATDNPVEFEAVLLGITGHAEAMLPVVRRLESGAITDDAFARIVDARNDVSAPAGHRVTPEGVKLAAARIAGTVEPEVVARLDAAEGNLRSMLAEQERLGLEGFGSKGDAALNPAELGNDPLAPVVAAKTRGAERKAEKQGGVLARAQEAADAAEARRVEVEALRADELDVRAAGHRAAAQTKRANLTMQAADKAAHARRQADITTAFAPADKGVGAGRAAGRAGRLRSTAATTERRKPDSRAIAQADLKADLLERRAQRIRTGKAAIVTDDAQVSLARHTKTEAAATLSKEARKMETAVRRLEKRRTEARLSPEAAPARIRTVLIGNQRVVAEMERMRDEANLADPGSGQVYSDAINDLATDIDAINDAGMGDRITYVMQGLATDSIGPSKVAATTQAPKVSDLARDKTRQGTTMPLTPQGLAKLYDRETRKMVGNRLAQRIAEEHGVTPASIGLGDLRGTALTEAMGRAGFEPYQVVAGGQVNPASAGKNTLWLPRSLAREFKGWSGQRWSIDEWLSVTWDPATAVFKMSVLPLSPRWHLGNMISNTILATVSAGMDPVTLVRYIKQAREFTRQGEFSGPLASGEAAVVRGGGLTNDVADVLRPVTSERKVSKVRAAASKKVQQSYNFNRTVDDLFRNAVYLRDLEKSGGNPVQAMESALRTMGDFGAMTAIERATLRRILPFYGWAKVITKISATLPYDHPYRVAWTLHLGGNLGGGAQQQAALPDWAKGALPLGGDKLLRLNFINPFGDATEPIVTPAGFTKSLHPLIKEGLALGVQRDVRKGGALSAPPGTEVGMSPLSPKAAGARLAGILPQTRALRDLPGDRVVRYGNQEPVLRSGRTIDASAPGGRLATLMQAAGIPWATYAQSEADKARTSKTDARNERSRASYDRKRRSAGKKEPAKR